ncbi:MAG TPA: LamG-like jellyroll fold domain-containing protein [Candidatus Baltobacteraceae bacterium]
MRSSLRLCALLPACALGATLAACSGSHNNVLPPRIGSGVSKQAVQQDAYQIAVLNDAPTAYYRLDDTGATAADLSGNGLTANIGGSVTKSAPSLVPSSSDAAMTFPGTRSATGIVSAPATAKLQPASAVSMEALLRFSTTPQLYTIPLAYGSDSNYAPYAFYFYTGGKIAAQFYLSSGPLVVISPSALQPNTSYHVVGTFDGSNARLYVNGTQVASGAKAGTLAGYLPGFGLGIGCDTAFSDPAFNGSLDEVAIYANTALSAAQVQTHYNAAIAAGPPPTPSPTATPAPTPAPTPVPTAPPPGSSYTATVLRDSPAAYYHLSDVGSVAVDSSGNGLSASIGSAVTKNVAGLVPSSGDAAMSFPSTRATSGILAVAQNAKLQPASTVSMEALLRFSATPTLYTIPLAYGSDSNYAPYSLFFYTGGRIAAQFYLTSGPLTVISPSGLAVNTSYHVVATFDGANASLYVNGAIVGNAAKSGTLTGYLPGYGLGMGDDTAFSDPAFGGTLDEVAIYTKALTAAQVSAHYNAAIASGPPPTPAPTPAPPPGGFVDWSTFGFDLPRTGYNPNESLLGPNNVASVHQLWAQKAQVGFGMVGEPVLASNVTIAGQPINVLYAGSNFGATAYAINADTGATIWQHAVGSVQYTCGTTSTFGISDTAAIDRARNRLYIGDGQAQVHALDLATGVEAPGWPVTIATTPGNNFIYGGLTYNPANGMLYAETSSTCDISPWFGRIVAIDASTAGIVGTFYPAQGSSGGGIWGYGGASVDPSTNNVFVAVGNSDGANQTVGYSEQIVELTPDVGTVLANNYPQIPSSPDADFGATPLLFQPPGCPPLLAAVNKSGAFVLYNRSNIGAGPIQNVQMSIATDNGDFIGVPAYDPLTNYVYIGLPATFGIYTAGLGAFGIQSNCTLNPTPVWNASFGPNGAAIPDDTPRSAISIAGGVAYVSNFSGQTLFAFDAGSGAQLWSTPLSDYGIPGPIVANGHLYVGAYDGGIMEWGTGSAPASVRGAAVKSPARRYVAHKIPYLNHRRRRP